LLIPCGNVNRMSKKLFKNGMKTKLLLTVLLFGLRICSGQENKPGEQQTQSLGKHWFVMYRKGSNWDQNSATKNQNKPGAYNSIQG